MAFSDGGMTTIGVTLAAIGSSETLVGMPEMLNGKIVTLGGMAPDVFWVTIAVEELKVVMLLRVLLSSVMLPDVDTVVVLLIVVFTTA